MSRLIDTALRAAERGALLTRQLLTFGQGQTLSPERLNLAGAMAEFRALLQRSAGEGVEVAFDVAAELPDAFLDKAQLEAAVLNLVCNSRDAMPQGGSITIAAYRNTPPILPTRRPRCGPTCA